MTGAMIPPAGEGVPLLNVTIALLVVCCATVAGRLSVRRWLKPEAMGLDDYLMVAGLVCVLPRQESRRRVEGRVDDLAG